MQQQQQQQQHRYVVEVDSVSSTAAQQHGATAAVITVADSSSLSLKWCCICCVPCVCFHCHCRQKHSTTHFRAQSRRRPFFLNRQGDFFSTKIDLNHIRICSEFPLLDFEFFSHQLQGMADLSSDDDIGEFSFLSSTVAAEGAKIDNLPASKYTSKQRRTAVFEFISFSFSWPAP